MKNYMYENMTLSAEAYNRKITITLPADADMFDFMEACRTLAVGLTFPEGLWDDAVLERAELTNSKNEVDINGNV
jgi:hypothetical protein